MVLRLGKCREPSAFIIMTNAEKDCRILWSKIVRHRDRKCIFCCSSGSEAFPLGAHHVFNKAQGNWTIIYDVDFGVTFCVQCHVDTPIGSDLFEKVIIKVRAVNEARADKILAQANKPIAPCFYPFEAKIVKNILKQQWAKISETSWMDTDCEGIRTINGL